MAYETTVCPRLGPNPDGMEHWVGGGTIPSRAVAEQILQDGPVRPYRRPGEAIKYGIVVWQSQGRQACR